MLKRISRIQARNPPTPTPFPIPRRQETPIPAKLWDPANKPRWVYIVLQVKRALDEAEPLWKQVFFTQVYLRFVRFCFFVLGVPPARFDENGQPVWVELRGGLLDHWRAEQAAERPQHSFQKVPLDSLLSEATSCRSEEQVFPLSNARKQYENNGHPTVEFKQSDVNRLDEKIAATDSLVTRVRELTAQ